MTFLQELNSYVVILAFLLMLIFIIGFIAGARNGGMIRHLPYFLSLSVLSVYGLITPFFFYMNGRATIIGTDISEYYGAGLFFNLLAVLFFVAGYWMVRGTNARWVQPAGNSLPRVGYYITLLFWVFYGISMLNLALGGVNLGRVFTGNATLGLGAGGATYYLQNFTDSLICVIILAYIYDIPKKRLVLMILAAFFLFSLLGFRYRIILTLMGILFVYLYKHRVSVRQVVWAGILGLVFFYAIMFSTVNRWVLVNRNYEELVLNPLEFSYETVFEQTRGGLADMAIYRHYDNPIRNASHDNGITLFGYVFIRMIPRTIMPDKDKFYPPPQLAITIQAYDAWWAKYSGEATLNIGAFYIAYGWLGVVLGGLLWGILLKRFANSIRRANLIQMVSYIVISLVLFQWITRGYMPQIIDQTIYMLIPVWILKILSKKNIIAK